MKKFALTVALLGLWAIQAVHAAEFFCPSGDVTCVIDAINKANKTPELDVIFLEAGTYILTSVVHEDDTFGPSGFPIIISSITIQGAGTWDTEIVRDPGAPDFRFFHIIPEPPQVVLTLKQLTLRGGRSVVHGLGGAIFNRGAVTLEDTLIADNFASISGGAIASGTTFPRNGRANYS